jgi:orotidine 5'-phosphate decarboxylase subfamily 1/orotate phosphoribosyltransferase
MVHDSKLMSNLSNLELPYEKRAELAKNPAARKLFELMASKKTNLVLANDEHDPEKFLKHCETIGPELAIMKTHIDILNNFTPAITTRLVELSKKHNFMIFEDRKFADTGNTVRLQYSEGVYRIADWANFVNLHIVPGPGIIDALQSVAESKKDGKARGFLVLAQMSSKGTMAVGDYTKKAIEIANDKKDAIAGYIGTGSVPETLKELSYVADPGHAILTPGVRIAVSKDALGQRWTHPREAIAAGSDAIVVGRGIYQAEDPVAEAKKYREAAWNAYLERIGKQPIAERIAKLFLETKAILIKPEDPFTYVSGIISPIYVDPRVLVSYPKQRKDIINSLTQTAKEIKDHFDVIGGVGTEGIPAASWLANNLNLPMIYLRSKAKGHGKENLIEGRLNKGEKVLLVTHMFTADNILTNSVNSIRAMGGEVSHCIALSDHILGDAANKLKELNVTPHALTDLKTILTTALKEKYISQTEYNLAIEWLADPSSWANKHKEKLEEAVKISADEIADVLLTTDAVTLRPDDPFRFVSGVLSPIYTDCRILLSHPQARERIIENMIKIINYKIGLKNIDVLGGVATSGIPHATLLAESLKLPMIYIYSKKLEHGKHKTVEGEIKKGNKVLIIEDLISSGGSAIKSIENVRKAGGIVTDCLAIFKYGFPKSKKNFEDAGVKLHTLSDLAALLITAQKKGIVNDAGVKEIERWVKDPENWRS